MHALKCHDSRSVCKRKWIKVRKCWRISFISILPRLLMMISVNFQRGLRHWKFRNSPSLLFSHTYCRIKDRKIWELTVCLNTKWRKWIFEFPISKLQQFILWLWKNLQMAKISWKKINQNSRGHHLKCFCLNFVPFRFLFVLFILLKLNLHNLHDSSFKIKKETEIKKFQLRENFLVFLGDESLTF